MLNLCEHKKPRTDTESWLAILLYNESKENDQVGLADSQR